MPAHAVGSDPEAANAIIASWTAADGTVLPSTGPMIFDGYNPGVDLHMVRNDSYYGSQAPDAKNDGRCLCERRAAQLRAGHRCAGQFPEVG